MKRWVYSCSIAALVAVSACKDDSGNREGTDQSGILSPPSAEGAPRAGAGISDQLRAIAERHAGEGRGFVIYLRLDDGQEWTEVAGTRKVGGPKTTGKERFEIGSITKLFTAVSILQLSETKALDLNGPLTDYFDGEMLGVLVGGEAGDVSALKVRHLLNHTTGMGDYINIGSDAEALKIYGTKGDKIYAPMDLLELTRSYTEDPSILPADHPPLPQKTLKGEGIETYDSMPGAFYSNAGYIMLGLVIEKASGMKYEEYVTRHILEPLKLTETGFRTRGANSDFTGYATGVTEEPVAMSPSFAWSAGTVVTTTEDLADFLEAALAGKLFQQDSTLAFWTAQGFKPLMGLDLLPKYGHGLMRRTLGELELFGHDGQTFGATALVARCDKLGATMVVAMNDSQHSNMWGTAIEVLATVKENKEANAAAGTAAKSH